MAVRHSPKGDGGPFSESILKSLGALAQLGEHLLCKQGVIGSIPIGSTSFSVQENMRGMFSRKTPERQRRVVARTHFSRDEDKSFLQVTICRQARLRPLFDIVNGFF